MCVYVEINRNNIKTVAPSTADQAPTPRISAIKLPISGISTFIGRFFPWESFETLLASFLRLRIFVIPI